MLTQLQSIMNAIGSFADGFAIKNVMIARCLQLENAVHREVKSL